MIPDYSKTERAHLSNLTASAPVSLVAKRCACGKATTAKQLTQHGKCAACALAAVVAAVLPEDIHRLKHMLGAGQHTPKKKWGWRNYFCSCLSGPARESMRRLESAGLATMYREWKTTADYNATRLGCKVAGLDAAATRRAME